MEEFDGVTFKGKYGRFKKGDKAVILDINNGRCVLEIFDKNGDTLYVIMGVPLNCLKLRYSHKKRINDMNKKNNIQNLLNLNYLNLSNLVEHYSKFNIPKVSAKFTIKDKYIVLYREYYNYFEFFSCLAFFDYDEEFYGKNGLFNALYYNNTKLIEEVRRLLDHINYVIQPDYINENNNNKVEDIYAFFKSKILAIHFLKHHRTFTIPLIYYKKEHLLNLILEHYENIHIVCFKFMEIENNEKNIELLKKAIKEIVDRFTDLKQVIVFTDIIDETLINNIFAYVKEKNIQFLNPENLYKKEKRITKKLEN